MNDGGGGDFRSDVIHCATVQSLQFSNYCLIIYSYVVHLKKVG